MADARSHLEVSMPAEPGAVRLMRTEVLRWFREQPVRDDGLASAIALATSEAVANVVRHAYQGDIHGRVELDASLGDDDILIRVCDRGLGLTARSDEAHNGLGLPVIGRVSNGTTVASDEAGTTVSMRFALPDRSNSPLRRVVGAIRPIGTA